VSTIAQDMALLGFAPVVAVLHRDRTDAGPSVTEHFSVAKSSQLAATSRAAAGPTNGHAASARYYRTLGVVYRTVDRNGLAALRADPAVRSVGATPAFSLIRPVDAPAPGDGHRRRGDRRAHPRRHGLGVGAERAGGVDVARRPGHQRCVHRRHRHPVWARSRPGYRAGTARRTRSGRQIAAPARHQQGPDVDHPELYLPKSWTGDRDRCRAAAVPDEIDFAELVKLSALAQKRWSARRVQLG
jgi:hypothetical protein